MFVTDDAVKCCASQGGKIVEPGDKFDTETILKLMQEIQISKAWVGVTNKDNDGRYFLTVLAARPNTVI